MKKDGVFNLACRKKAGLLEYLILEHTAAGPAKFLCHLINEYSFGMLFLGHDGPSLLSAAETQRLLEGMRNEGIIATLSSGLLWVSLEGILKLCKVKKYSFEGDAVVLKTQSSHKYFECAHLPSPTGFKRDNLSSKDATFLDLILSDDDVYIHDDFRESFVVSKSSKILDTILEEIKRFKI